MLVRVIRLLILVLGLTGLAAVHAGPVRVAGRVLPWLRPSSAALLPGTAAAVGSVSALLQGGVNWPQITLTTLVSGLAQPLHVTHAGDGSARLFVVERGGRIRIVKNGSLVGTPFLDITDRVRSQDSEQGLLSVAFPPGYAGKGYFYVNYTDLDGDTVVARYDVTANADVADPNSEEVILTVDQPYSNHNGGQLAFGPDGYLYIGMGDGGSGGDPFNYAQNPASLLGKLLRIDVESGVNPYAIPASNPFTAPNDPGGVYRDEIWALGLRNPWRFSFDRQTGDLYIGDVGQNAWEEVDFQPASSPGGENYGWRCKEGSHDYNMSGNCPNLTLVPPIHEYSNSWPDCSITGGMVYRGGIYGGMQGIYIFADYCSGRIRGLQHDGAAWQNAQLYDASFNINISSFGEDEVGNLYVAGYNNGLVYLITEVATATPTASSTPSPTPSATPSATPTRTGTPTPTATASATATTSPSCAFSGPDDFHVAPGGSDGNAGTLAAPWSTIQHAADTVGPGDTVYVHAGTYNEAVAVNTSGTSGSPITLRACPGETVVLDGTGLGGTGFEIGSGVSYVRLDGLVVQNFSGWGVAVAGGTEYIELLNLEVRDNGDSGVRLYGEPWPAHILIRDLYTHDNGLLGLDCSPGCRDTRLEKVHAANNGPGGNTAADGIGFEDGDGVTVIEALAEGNGGDGLDFKADGVVIERSISRGNGRDNIKLWGLRSTLTNSLSADSGLTGLVLAGGGSYTVTNSLIATSDIRGYLATFGEYEAPTVPTTVTLYNTIFFNDNPANSGTTLWVASGVSMTADYNLYYNPYRTDDVIDYGPTGRTYSAAEINDGTWFAETGNGEHSAYADPLFADAPNRNFHLTATSPAVDSGTVQGAPSIDLDGNPRPKGAAVDIGPYEYCALLGDTDCDCQVTSTDVMAVADRWHRPDLYDADFDLNNDGTIDVVDVMHAAAHWGETC